MAIEKYGAGQKICRVEYRKIRNVVAGKSRATCPDASVSRPVSEKIKVLTVTHKHAQQAASTILCSRERLTAYAPPLAPA
ncbi:hypothetical protein [Stappia sp. ES.058]|uniref:hypothetical protein n=1 Tax=Stappia sp. ES.058 TaxID=1881061 RepID=UPI0012FE1C7B|nr:hypothetical protein [Stappia sp. ES.058]